LILFKLKALARADVRRWVREGGVVLLAGFLVAVRLREIHENVVLSRASEAVAIAIEIGDSAGERFVNQSVAVIIDTGEDPIHALRTATGVEGITTTRGLVGVGYTIVVVISVAGVPGSVSVEVLLEVVVVIGAIVDDVHHAV
jgi:hypothetical protein